MKKKIIQYRRKIYPVFLSIFLFNLALFSADEKLTLDFKDAEIGDVLRAIGTKYHISIVVDRDVQGKINIHLSDVSLEEALKIIVESSGFILNKEGNVYRVQKKESIRRVVVSVKDSLLSLDVQDADITDVLRKISIESGLNIITDPSVRGRITGVLREVPVKKGLISLLKANGYTIREENGIIEVSKLMPQAGKRYGKGVNVKVENDSLISINVHNAKISDILAQISYQSNINIIQYGKIEGTITARFSQIPFNKGLSLLFQGTKYTFKKVDNTYLVGEKSIRGPASSALTRVDLIKLKYIKAEGIIKSLPPNIPAQNVKVIKEQNALLTVGTDDAIQQIKEFIKKVDLPSPRVMIRALILEVSRNAMKEIGIRGGYFSPDSMRELFPEIHSYLTTDQIENALNFIASSLKIGTIGKLPANFITTIDALENAGKAKVKAEPKVVTLNGNKASINVGWVGYYRTTTGTPENPIIQLHSVSAGVKLEIVPWISAYGDITTELNVEVSSLRGFSSSGLPEISKRSANTTIRLNDGETIIIGGLIQSTQSQRKSKIPILSDLPIIGNFLFTRTSTTSDETELLIYITPYILDTIEGIK